MNCDAPNIDEIYWEAAQLTSSDEQAVFLDRACEKTPALRQQIEKLLRARTKAERFLEQPAAAPIAATLDMPPVTETVGSVIGPYKLMEQIGEGGMGVVYVAQQEKPVKRRVALKIIKPGMDTKQVIARFEAERQALALMDHPNIAKVLDVGATETGQPFFCMELVRGLPITEYCDKKTLNTRERLDLFILVCKAVQHAHQKGIIHRDLKPSNILVTIMEDGPLPKVIDFGVAKATNQQLTEHTLYTAHSQMIGTPLYMSPEQAEMTGFDIDTRSDVYSLGVLLYELLTGTTPFDKQTLKEAGFDEMRRIIREEEPPRPSDRISTLQAEALSTVSAHRNIDPHRFSRQIQGELDWIVMQALEKDRTRRYESASAFAADVQRYLNDEPVEACPPSTVYRLRKYTRRNKGVLSTLILVTVALLAGTGISLWQANKARDALKLADQRFEDEQQARRDTDTQRDLAESNLQLAMDALNAVYLQAVGTDRVFDDRELIESRRILTGKEKQLLQTGLDFYAQIASQNDSNTTATFGAAQAFLQIGNLRASLGEEQEAETAISEAITRFRKLSEAFPDNAPYFRHLGDAYFAKATLKQYTPQSKALCAESHRALSRSIELGSNNASAYSQRGWVRRHQRIRGWAGNNRNAYSQSLADFERAVELEPGNPKLHNQFAVFLSASGQFRKGSRSLEHAEKAVQLDPDNASYLVVLASLNKGRNTQRAIFLLEKAIELDPSNDSAFDQRSRIYMMFGEHEKALAESNRAVLLSPSASRYVQRAGVHRALKRIDKSFDDFKLAEQADPNHTNIYAYRSDIYMSQKRYQEALADFNKALKLVPTKIWLYKRRAMAHLHLGHYDEALADINKEMKLNSSHSWQYPLRALIHFHMEQYDKALADIAKAVKMNSSDTFNLSRIPPCRRCGLSRQNLPRRHPQTRRQNHRAERRFH
jgi:serine/threonine protein kinase/tetratricopeptide (TPR) repeat protein